MEKCSPWRRISSNKLSSFQRCCLNYRRVSLCISLWSCTNLERSIYQPLWFWHTESTSDASPNVDGFDQKLKDPIDLSIIQTYISTIVTGCHTIHSYEHSWILWLLHFPISYPTAAHSARYSHSILVLSSKYFISISSAATFQNTFLIRMIHLLMPPICLKVGIPFW